jgi:hypothetical protein
MVNMLYVYHMMNVEILSPDYEAALVIYVIHLGC